MKCTIAGFCSCVGRVISAILFCAVISVQADFLAYNDCAWDASNDPQPGNFTTNSPYGLLSGALTSESGVLLPVQVSFGGVASPLIRMFGPPAGSDADATFTGHIGTNNAANWTAGTISMTLSGLDPSKRYDVTLWSTRGSITEAYSNRYTDIVLSGANLFTNSSSAGVPMFTAAAANDGTRVRASWMGSVARYRGIDAGSDGQVVFTMTAGADATWPANGAYNTNGYLNAFLVQEHDGPAAALMASPAYWKGVSEPPGGAAAWRFRNYDASSWLIGESPYWYGDGAGGTQVSDMQNGYATLYTRIPFVVTNATAVQQLMLTMDYDDAFVAWINGVQVAASFNSPLNPTFTSLASPDHESTFGGGGPAEVYGIGGASLVTGTNYLAIQGFNVATGSSDFVLNPSVQVVYLGSSSGTNWGTNMIWVALGTPERRQYAPSTRRTTLVISEIMYNPREQYSNGLDFVEVFNPDPVPVEVGDWTLKGDIAYTFPPGLVISSRCYKVIAKAPSAVQNFYGISGVLGPYSNELSDAGGTLRMENEQGAHLWEVTYSDANPWPVAADGAGHSLHLARPDHGEADGRAWTASATVGGNPGAPNPTLTNYPLTNVCLNEFMAHTDPPQEDFIEIYNRSTGTVNVGGCYLTDDPSNPTKFRIPIGTSLNAKACASFPASQLGFGLSMHGGTLLLVNPTLDVVLDGTRYGAQENGVARGRWPDGQPGWQELTAVTAAAVNRTTTPKLRSVVINEIMYNPISEDDDDEYVELYNASGQAVDLSYWRFMDGIDYMFPPGTTLGPTSYLVVAKNAAQCRTNHPGLGASACLGDYSGTLSNSGEQLALAKPDDPALPYQDFVVVDEVTYADYWGHWTDGGGSALELIDPRSDNRERDNWDDSDESHKSSWATFQTVGDTMYAPFMTHFGDNEVHLMLLDKGECLVDDIEVLKYGNGVFSQGTFESGLDGAWKMDGFLSASSLETTEGYNSSKSLHVRAEDGGDIGTSHIERDIDGTPFTGYDVGVGGLTLRFKARWLAGTPLVNARIHVCIEAGGAMPIPKNLGTPGARNSRYASNTGPSIRELGHEPALPASGQGAVVSMQVRDPDGVTNATLYYRVDPSTSYASVSMNDAGTGGDVSPNDGTWSGTIPGQGGDVTVGFYVQARDSQNALTQYPKDPANHECFIMFGQYAQSGNFGSVRVWTSDAGINTWYSRPRVDNASINATVVYNDARVVYGGGVHYKSSPYTRNAVWAGSAGHPETANQSYTVMLPGSDTIMASDKFILDYLDNGSGTFQMEQFQYWMASKLGLPFSPERYMHVYINQYRKGVIYGDVFAPSGEYKDMWFPGKKGELYECGRWEFYNDDYTSLLEWGGSWDEVIRYEDGVTPRSVFYRWLFPKKGRTNADYGMQSLYDVQNTIFTPQPSSDSSYAKLSALIDVRQWAQSCALRNFSGDWDGNGWSAFRNGFYFKPDDGKWKMVPWDMDLFGDYGRMQGANVYYGIWNGFSGTYSTQVFVHVEARRAYLGALDELVRGPGSQAAYNARLTGMYNVLRGENLNVASPFNAAEANCNQSPSYYGGSGLSMAGWLDIRRSIIQSSIQSYTNFAFNVTTTDASVSATPATVLGVAPLKITDIYLNGTRCTLRWTSETNWETKVGLKTGANSLVFTAYDSDGNPAGSDTVNLTSTATPSDPVGRLIINEIMYHSTTNQGNYVEIVNRSGSTTFELGGWRLDGLNFTFPVGSTVAPGQYIMVAEDRGGYMLAYTNITNLAGEYSGSLDKGGETISLEMPTNTAPGVTNWIVIDQVRYDDDPPWPTNANGVGPSLQLLDSAVDNGRPSSWYATGRSPGMANTVSSNLAMYPLLWINEVMPRNTAGPRDNAGEFAPFVEIYNAAGSNFNLGDGTFYLTDTYGQLTKHLITGTQNVSAGGRLAIWCDGESGSENASGFPHTSWTLNNASGVVALVRVSSGIAQIVDYLAYNQIPTNKSYGSWPEGDPLQRQVFDKPTANAANNSTSTLATVKINEWMAANGLTLVDPADGKFNDWFELYNPGDQAVDLAGWSLTDDLASTNTFIIPGGRTIAARGYLLVWADGDTALNASSGYDLHAGFKLGSTSGVIGLYAPDGRLVDSVSYGQQTEDISQGRFDDGSVDLYDMSIPTPGSTNRLFAATSMIPGVAPGTVNIQWTARVGKKYTLMHRPTLTTGWQVYAIDISPVAGMVGTNLMTSPSRQFFKLVQQ